MAEGHQQQQATENDSSNQHSQVINISEHENEQQVKNTEISEAKRTENHNACQEDNNNTRSESVDNDIWSSITSQQNASLEALHQSITMGHNNENSPYTEPQADLNQQQHQSRSPNQQPQQPVHQASESDGKPAVGSDEWHKQRRENHKQVERRRRENINEGINEIARIVPGCEKNKGSILNRAASYIRQLKDTEAATLEKWTLEKLLTDQAINELNRQVEVFKAELERVKLENNYLKRELESVTNGENSLLREVKKQKMEHQTSMHDE
ncbi:unnamed protein product [Mucor hiemalis]